MPDAARAVEKCPSHYLQFRHVGTLVLFSASWLVLMYSTVLSSTVLGT